MSVKRMKAVLLFLALCLASVQAQVLVNIAPTPKLQFVDLDGKPLAGGCVFTYAAGTTTPQATYTDNTGATQNANPVILDSGGRASIWLNSFQAYKFSVWANGGFFNNNCTLGQLQYTTDGINAAFSLSSLAISGAFTATSINGISWVGPSTGQFPSLPAAIAAANANGTSGQTIYVSPGQVDPTWTANVAVSVNFLTIVFTGSYYANTSTFNFQVADGVIGFAMKGSTNPPNNFGATPCTGQVVFDYRGSGSAITFSISSGTNGVGKINVEGVGVCLSNAGTNAIGIDMYRIGAHSRFVNMFVGTSLNSNSQIGWRLNTLSAGDSEGLVFDTIGAAGTNICFQNNGNTIDDVVHIDCVGPGTTSSIGIDNEAGASNGESAIHIFGNSISGYGTSVKGVKLVQSWFVLETESNEISGQPDVVLDSNSNHVEGILTGSVTKTVTDSGSHNHIYSPGTGSCYTGCTTTTVRTGTGSGTYSTTSTSFTNVDGTNLSYTITIPTGWKLLIQATANLYTATASTNCNLAIADGGTPVAQTVIAGSPSTTLGTQTTVLWAITGDGNSHTVSLQYKTANSSDPASILNAASGVPVMTFLLTSSN